MSKGVPIEMIESIVNELKNTPYTLFMVIVLMLSGAYGWTNFARSADVGNLKEEMQRKLVAVHSRVAENGDKISRVLSLQTADAIRSLGRQICGTLPGVNRNDLERALDGLQGDYMKLQGKYYPLESCD